MLRIKLIRINAFPASVLEFTPAHRASQLQGLVWGQDRAMADGGLESPEVLNFESVDRNLSFSFEVEVLLIKNV